jgi:hypothetical protein
MTTRSNTKPKAALPAETALGLAAAAPMAGMSDWMRQISACQVAWQEQWWGFMSKRLSKDAAFAQRLLSCKTPDEIGRAYSDYFTQTIADYQNEASNLTRLGTEVSVATMPIAPNGHDILAPQEMTMLGKLNA